MSLKDLDTFPTLVPIPKLDGHVIRAGQDKRLSGMDADGTNVIWVSLEAGNLLARIIVVYAKLEVITATDDPVLPRNEPTSSDGDISDFERLNSLLGFVRPDVNMSRVESRQNPWLSRVEIDTLHTLTASEELPLDGKVMR
jgi:hypothetical protein